MGTRKSFSCPGNLLVVHDATHQKEVPMQRMGTRDGMHTTHMGTGKSILDGELKVL
jgi:hypothetical protein